MTIGVQIQKTERKINGIKFYPVHLTNEEIRKLILSVLQCTELENNTHYQVFIRKDKSSKGLDFRLQNSKGMYASRDLITYSINPHWKVSDAFIHLKVTALYRRNNLVDVLNSDAELEFKNLIIPEIDEIFIGRLQDPETPYRNSLFERDDWVCVMEKNDVLADTPY